jgi:outer membrane protein assembly factor BamB
MYALQRKLLLLLGAVICAGSVFSQNNTANQGQNLSNSEPFWRQALGGSVLSMPSVQAQSVVVALDGGNIKAYSVYGTPIWNYSARGKISPYVTRSPEGTSYIARTNGILIAVNRSGRELWRRNIGNSLSARVITGWDGRLFVPAGKTLLCYTASGNLLWTRTFETAISLAPCLSHSGGIIFTLENNEVYRIDPFGNSNLWTLTNKPAALVSIDHYRIMALYTDGSMEIIGSAEDWYISSQNEFQFTLLPKLSAGVLAAAYRNGNITAILNNGKISFVSLDERKILWEGDSHIRENLIKGGKPETEAEIIFDERGIYILSKNGASGFSHDGNRLWLISLQNSASIPVIDENGLLYSGGNDWILYAYKAEDRPLSARDSFYGTFPEGSYKMGSPQEIYMPPFPLSEYEIKRTLDQIGSAVKFGRVGANEGVWTTFLLALSANQAHIQYRASALRLLGQIGSRETIPWLVSIFNRENEPVIKAAAASAIGDIGTDPDGIAIQAFLYSIIYSGTKESQVLSAITSATGALCRFSGPPLSQTGVKILNLLCESYQSSAIRRQALKELSSLQ